MNLVKLLLIHAIVTFAAGVVLLVAPDLIPRTVGIRITSSVYLVCYLLGTSELGLATLSYYSRTLKDAQSLRVVSLSFIVLHASTAAVEVYAFLQGVSPIIWANIALRILVVMLFLYYGLYKTSARSCKSQDYSGESPIIILVGERF